MLKPVSLRNTAGLFRQYCQYMFRLYVLKYQSRMSDIIATLGGIVHDFPTDSIHRV